MSLPWDDPNADPVQDIRDHVELLKNLPRAPSDAEFGEAIANEFLRRLNQAGFACPGCGLGFAEGDRVTLTDFNTVDEALWHQSCLDAQRVG